MYMVNSYCFIFYVFFLVMECFVFKFVVVNIYLVMVNFIGSCLIEDC